jgi:hypothetical protein
MLASTRSMKAVRDFSDFPTPAMVEQMYKKFGAALTAADIDGVHKRSLSEVLAEGGELVELSSEQLLEAAQGLPGRRLVY